MDDKTKDDFIQIFNQGFENVILPHIEDIDQRLGKVEASLNNLDSRVDQIDRKLDLINDKTLDQDKRLISIESIPTIAHQIKK